MLNDLIVIISGPQPSYLLGMVFAVLVVGIAASMFRGNFNFLNLADVLQKHLAPVLLIYTGVAVLAWARPDYFFVKDTVFGLLMARLGAELLQNLAEAGLPMPSWLIQLLTQVEPAKPVTIVGLHDEVRALPVKFVDPIEIVRVPAGDPPLAGSAPDLLREPDPRPPQVEIPYPQPNPRPMDPR